MRFTVFNRVEWNTIMYINLFVILGFLLKMMDGHKRSFFMKDLSQITDQGGLLSKGKSKVVYIETNDIDLQRCPVTIFKTYLGLLP